MANYIQFQLFYVSYIYPNFFTKYYSNHSILFKVIPFKLYHFKDHISPLYFDDYFI